MGSSSSKKGNTNPTPNQNQVINEPEPNKNPNKLSFQETIQIQDPFEIPINYNKYKSNIFWIDKNVYNEENQKYLNYLVKINNFTILPHKDINSALIEIKKIKFEDTYIILSGYFYQEFILRFKGDLKSFYVIPKIIIFTSNKKRFLEKNENIKDLIEDSFYNLGGIQTFFDEVYYDFLTKKVWKKKFIIKNNEINSDIGKQFIFEYIDCEEKLLLPSYFKGLIGLKEEDNFDELTQYLYNSYSKNNESIKNLLEPIEGISKLPIEILCKYFARLYTIESEFYKNLNQSLREARPFNHDNYYSVIFIKAFYEGIKLGSFSLYFNNKLYRFSCVDENEFKLIKKYLKKKKKISQEQSAFQNHFYLLVKTSI